jgi:NAD(P)-dependent dehydrogenase (short-subunit alcohol dehydrogenase family)
MELAGITAIVTGGASGIGAALATSLRRRGAGHVVVADLDAGGAAEVARAVEGTAVSLDVRDEEAIVDLVARTTRDHGPVGVFASNAGYVTLGGLEDDNARIQHMWEVHVMAHIYAARAVIPSMAASGSGHLLITASAAGLLSQIGSMAYTITKHAAVALGEWLAISHHHQGIGVSVLCPQAVRTDLLDNSPDELAGDGRDPWETGPASGDGVLEPGGVAELACDAIEADRFLVLPHSEVATYVQRKAGDVERWLAGMRRLQRALAGDGPLPGDALLGD